MADRRSAARTEQFADVASGFRFHRPFGAEIHKFFLIALFARDGPWWRCVGERSFQRVYWGIRNKYELDRPRKGNDRNDKNDVGDDDDDDDENFVIIKKTVQ